MVGGTTDGKGLAPLAMSLENRPYHFVYRFADVVVYHPKTVFYTENGHDIDLREGIHLCVGLCDGLCGCPDPRAGAGKEDLPFPWGKPQGY